MVLDQNYHSCMIFSDLSTVFDRVWQKDLLFKLKYSRTSLSRTRLFRITAYLEVKI